MPARHGPEPSDLERKPGLETPIRGADGVAEALWTTEAPNKKGVGGTTPGAYTATTTTVTADGYQWDGQATSAGFTLQ